MGYRSTRRLVAAVAVALLALGPASAAQGKIVERDRFSFTESGTDDLCGLDVAWEVEVRGHFRIRADRQDSPAFLYGERYEFREVITNLDNGRWGVIRGKGNFREVTATQVDGDIYRFRVQDAGQPFVIENSDGKVVYRERGLLVFESVWDTFGDDEPGGELLSFEFVSAHGYPGFIEDLCPLAHELLG